MSIDYSELKDAVVGELEIDATDADRYEFDANIITAQLGILNSLPFKYLKNAIKTVKFNVSIGVNLYQWPDDFIRHVRLWVDYANPITASNEGSQVTEYDDQAYHAKTVGQMATKRYPYGDYDVEGGFGIYPVPDADVTNGFRLRHVWQIPNPTSIQPCLLEYNLRNLLILRTTELCALVDEFNVQLADRMNKLYAEELAKFLPKKDKR
jgi:hypothetical protein